MSNALYNPPSFLDTDRFLETSSSTRSDRVPTNPETLDIFSDLNWLDITTNATPSQPLNNDSQTVPQTLPQPQQVSIPTLPFQPLPSTDYSQTNLPEAIVSDNTLKRDIIKHLYNSGQCGYLKTCFAKIEDIDTITDNALYKKFQVGILIDSLIGNNSQEKNLATYCFSFFQSLLDEAKAIAPPELKNYFEIFSCSLQKEKINILNDSGAATVATILAAKDLDKFLEKHVASEMPSLRALKCSLQNISLLVSLTLTKKLLSPLLVSMISGKSKLYDDGIEKNEEEPLQKKKKLSENE